MSITEICEKFWQLEKKLNLLDFSINGIKPWQAHRIHFYLDLVAKIKLFDKHINIIHKVGMWDHIRFFIFWLYGCVFKNPFCSFRKKDILIIEHQRKKLIQNKKVDIYTQYYIEELLGKNIKFEVYCSHYYHAGTFQKNVGRYSLDIFTFIYRVLKIFIRPQITHNDKKKIKQIEAEIENVLGIKYNLYSTFHEITQIIKIKYLLWLILLKIKKPKKIVLLVSYGWADLIKAAKKLGIPVVEFQHGIFSKFHLGYSFPYKKVAEPLDYFPDYFFVWGDYWKKIISLPLPENRIIVSGFAHFNNILKKNRKYIKNNTLIVLSQGGIGNELAKFISDNMNHLQHYKIFYKLHPSEYKIWREYNYLVNLKTYPRVEIIDNDKVDLYDLLSQSKYQAGIFSTALYEGIGFGCKTFIVKLPGWEYMESLIDNKFAVGLEPKQYSYNFIEKMEKENLLQFDIQTIFNQSPDTVLLHETTCHN